MTLLTRMNRKYEIGIDSLVRGSDVMDSTLIWPQKGTKNINIKFQRL